MSRAVFFDKDGTLVENVPFNVDPVLVMMTPGAEEALGRLARLGFDLVVVSNQPGVALGYFDPGALDRIRCELEGRFRQAGARLAGFYVCPHHPAAAQGPAGCACRKPQPDLLYRAAADLALDLSASWLVGDILDDVEAGRAAGCQTILIDNGNETEWRFGPLRQPHFIVSDLTRAAMIISETTRGAARDP
jgi:D-glycero-D-manno-heptose 1,7-bisphosphate phosphatase